MMLDLHYELNLLLTVATSVVLGLAVLSILRFERRCRELRDFWDSPTGAALRDSSDETEDSEALAERLAALQAAIEKLQEASGTVQQRVEGHSGENTRSAPFANAVRMVKHGATTEDLTKTCGLNIGEAHLLQRLHSTKRLQKEAAH